MTNVQTDIFSLFNIVDDHAVKKQKEAEELKKKEQAEREVRAAELKKKVAAAAGNKKAEAKKETPKVETVKFEPNEDTIIRHFGESIAITAYFTVEELAEGLLVTKKDSDPERKPLEPEMLRKRMEKDFPELDKNHTEIIFLKDKNIILPVQKAKKKGYCSETLSSDSVSRFISKIPFHILRDFIALAKFYGEQKLEIHADIYFQNGSFFLDVPGQDIHEYFTEVTESAINIGTRVEDAIKVMEIHSHHQMAPRPSLQDNLSERVQKRLYAIVGFTNKLLPDITVRAFISEEYGHIELSPLDVFEDPFMHLPSFEDKKVKVVAK
ncbi:hypothetical protein [Bacillus cihuensis]|uniref:hypothetical protein n=1 Tax=Bacillus cihuensis TaxID=1208599 RepID=UPI0003F55A2C|nr:hypothetical protein [Bacillus cihuensis]